MSDFDDDFGDYDDGGFEEDGFMDGDSMEDEFYEAHPGEDVNDPGDELAGNDEADLDGFTGEDAFYLGSAMGWAYEEGREEARHRWLMRKEWREGRKKC
jgi:hypothetical protein